MNITHIQQKKIHEQKNRQTDAKLNKILLFLAIKFEHRITLHKMKRGIMRNEDSIPFLEILGLNKANSSFRRNPENK